MTARDDTRRLLTAQQTADLLNLPSVQALYSRRSRSNGSAPPAIRIGGALRWRRSDIDAWLAAHREDQSPDGMRP